MNAVTIACMALNFVVFNKLNETIRAWPGTLRTVHPDAGIDALGFHAKQKRRPLQSSHQRL